MPGPDKDQLRALYNSLPGFVEDLEKRRALRGGKPVGQKYPTRCCGVCGRMCFFSDIIQPTDKPPELSLCERCQNLLADGWTAFVAMDKYAFGKSSNWPDIAGKIAPITPEQMQMLADKHMLDVHGKDAKPKDEE